MAQRITATSPRKIAAGTYAMGGAFLSGGLSLAMTDCGITANHPPSLARFRNQAGQHWQMAKSERKHAMEAMEQAQHAIAKAFGFRQEHTGGGCMAYVRHFAGGVHAMVTNGDADLPDGTDWLVGAYNADGEPLEFYRRGDCLNGYADAIRDAAQYAEANTPTTDALADEFAAWAKAQGFPEEEDAEGLLSIIAEQRFWLEDFVRRWNQVQAKEDFEQACRARGEAV